MSTRPIPAGTVNFPVNMPEDLRRDAGRLAFCAGESLGAWVREMIAAKVEAARRSGLLDTTGQLTIRLPVLALAAVGMGAVIAAVVAGTGDDLLARRMARRRGRDEVVEMGGAA